MIALETAKLVMGFAEIKAAIGALKLLFAAGLLWVRGCLWWVRGAGSSCCCFSRVAEVRSLLLRFLRLLCLLLLAFYSSFAVVKHCYLKISRCVTVVSLWKSVSFSCSYRAVPRAAYHAIDIIQVSLD